VEKGVSNPEARTQSTLALFFAVADLDPVGRKFGARAENVGERTMLSNHIENERRRTGVTVSNLIVPAWLAWV